MSYSISRIDTRNVARVIATGLSLETANRVRESFAARYPDDDFVVQPIEKKERGESQSLQSAAVDLPARP